MPAYKTNQCCRTGNEVSGCVFKADLIQKYNREPE